MLVREKCAYFPLLAPPSPLLYLPSILGIGGQADGAKCRDISCRLFPAKVFILMRARCRQWQMQNDGIGRNFQLSAAIAGEAADQAQ